MKRVLTPLLKRLFFIFSITSRGPAAEERHIFVKCFFPPCVYIYVSSGVCLCTDLVTIESWTGVSGGGEAVETVQVRGSIRALRWGEWKKEAGDMSQEKEPSNSRPNMNLVTVSSAFILWKSAAVSNGHWHCMEQITHTHTDTQTN